MSEAAKQKERYEFVKCQTHPKCPDVVGWYLKLDRGDIDTEMRLHRMVCVARFMHVMQDPHMHDKHGRSRNEIADILSPVKLGAQWLMTVNRMPRPVLINSVGGICPMDRNVTILQTVRREDLCWPGEHYANGERISIRRWPNAKHFYLSSSGGRIFDPFKFNTFKEAHDHALLFAPAERIEEAAPVGPRPNGD